MTKYIFVTGGVVSSLGKGVAAASLGSLLQARGFTVRVGKFDPYLNIDPSQMSPLQHGEVFVTHDGYETDLDLGYYERFLGIKLSKDDSVSGGRIYWEVLNKERAGDYKGATVQMIPHITNQIKEHIKKRGQKEDFAIYEIGGTVGDIEGLIFLEAIRQFANEVGRRNSMFVHLTLVPYINSAKELKTKPTQASVKALLEKGIQADLLLCRSSVALSKDDREKLALFCNLAPQSVITALDLDNIYKIPLAYEEQHVCERILEHFTVEPKQPVDLSKLERIANYLSSDKKETTIAMVGKYFETPDSYKSLNEAIFHAGIANNVKVNVKQIPSESLENISDEEIEKLFKDVKGILVPGGFGSRGIPGKIRAIKYARENKIPYFGIGLGFQLAAVEFAKNVAGISDAHSAEFEANCTAVVYAYDSRKLRLGNFTCQIKPDTLAHKVYGQDSVLERHRNAYELDDMFEDTLKKCGMTISARAAENHLPEILEIEDHPFFIGVQFLPEYQSSPFTSHPLFKEFIKAGLGN